MPDPIAATSTLPPPQQARDPHAGAAKVGARGVANLWQSKALVAFLGLLGAAVAPVTTYMYKQTELAIENARVTSEVERNKRQQNHDIRLTYFDKALDRTKDDGYRESVLAFLSLSNEDDKLSQWARSEAERLQERRERAAAELAAKQRGTDDLKARIGRLEAELKSGHEPERVRVELQSLNKQKREGEQALLELKQQQEEEEKRRRSACQTKCKATQETCANSCENLYDGKRLTTCQNLCTVELGSCTGGC